MDFSAAKGALVFDSAPSSVTPAGGDAAYHSRRYGFISGDPVSDRIKTGNQMAERSFDSGKKDCWYPHRVERRTGQGEIRHSRHGHQCEPGHGRFSTGVAQAGYFIAHRERPAAESCRTRGENSPRIGA